MQNAKTQTEDLGIDVKTLRALTALAVLVLPPLGLPPPRPLSRSPISAQSRAVSPCPGDTTALLVSSPISDPASWMDFKPYTVSSLPPGWTLWMCLTAVPPVLSLALSPFTPGWAPWVDTRAGSSPHNIRGC